MRRLTDAAVHEVRQAGHENFTVRDVARRGRIRGGPHQSAVPVTLGAYMSE